MILRCRTIRYILWMTYLCEAACQSSITSDGCAAIGERFTIQLVSSNPLKITWQRSDKVFGITSFPSGSACRIEDTAAYNLTRYTFTCDSNEFKMHIENTSNNDLNKSWNVAVYGDKQSYYVDVRLCEGARITLAQKVLEGKNVTLSCTRSRNPYPEWTGPNLDGSTTTYNYVNKPILNHNLGEKISRLTWDPQNNRSLIMKNVVKNDSGVYTCNDEMNALEIYTVSVIAQPQSPVISNKVSLDETRIVIRSTEDEPVELTCTSTGGYSKPNLRWYRGNNQKSLISNETFKINGDGNYIVVLKYKFTPTRQDDRVSYLCQSSFDLPEPSYLSDQVLLYLNLKPLSPLIETYTIVEGILGKAAICTASQYRPNNTQVWLQINGANITTVPDISVTHNVTTETFTIVALFHLVLNRHFNGQGVSCHLSHDTLQTPLIVTSTIPVYYAPDVEVTTTNVTVFDTAKLTCKASGLPAVYTYSNWRHTWPGHGTVPHNKTLGNNQTLRLTSLTYEFSGVYHCSASNGVTGSLNPNAGYGATFLQVGTFPIILTQSPIQVFTTLKTDISVTINFYSNRQNNMVQCSRNLTSFSCASILEIVDISLPVFDFIVQTQGLAAKVFLSIHERNQFGTFTITISNDVGETSIDVIILHSEEIRTIHTEHTLVSGLIGLAVAFIICIIAVVVFVVWKRRSRENTRRNASLKSRGIPPTENQSPTEDIELGPRQDDNCNVDTHVYEELGERNENILEYERMSSGNDLTDSRNVAYENIQIVT